MSPEVKFQSLNNIVTSSDRRQAHKILDELNVPKGTLEYRVGVLECRYPESK